MRRHFVSMLVIFALSYIRSATAADPSDAEYMRKLSEFQRKANSAGTQPSRQSGWKVKEGSPAWAKDWVENLIFLKGRTTQWYADEIERMGRGKTLAERDRDERIAAVKTLLSKINEDRYFIGWPDLIESCRTGSVGTANGFKVLQIIDRGNCLVAKGAKVFWLTNFSTDGWIDGDAIPETTWFISGTKRYGTIDGASKTTLLLKPAPLSPYLENWPAQYDPALKSPAMVIWPGYIPVRPSPGDAVPADRK